MQDLPPAEDLLDSGAQAPVIRMINALLLQALRERASDLHFEPYEGRSVVRFRVDGVLHDVIEPPRALHAALVSRLKIMASLDIAEKRLPQDGRIALKLGDKQVDVRVSTLPTGPGERVVLRLLDKDSARLDLALLGMSAPTQTRDRPADPRAARHRARHRAHGLGQDDDALRGAVAAAARRAQHDDGRGPDRIRARRRRADAGQSARSSSTSRARCARSCARIPTSS